MKVVIIGGAAKPENLLEEYGDDYEFWGLNNIRPKWTSDIKWSRWFNLHMYAHLLRDWIDGVVDEIAWARRNPKVPFYTCDEWADELPNGVLFPRAELKNLAGHEYHAGSLDWLVAFAIHLGATKIALHGITLALDSPRDEPISARACLEYWIGFAAGRGIEVYIAPDCDIMCQYHLVKSNTVYGYDDVKLIYDRTKERID